MSLDKTLSVIHKTDSFFYVISDKYSTDLCADELQRFDMSDLSWINEFKKQEFSKIVISILSNNFTLLPSNYNGEISSESMYSLLDISPSFFLDQDLIYSQDIKLVFAYDNNADWLNSLRTCSDNVQIHHFFSPILQNISYNHKQDGIYAFVEKDELGIIVMKNGKPLLVNMYRINNVEEYLYFILLAFQQTGLSAERDNLFLAGQVMVESQLYRYIYKYIRNLSFLNVEDNQYDNSYTYYDILSLMKYG